MNFEDNTHLAPLKRGMCLTSLFMQLVYNLESKFEIKYSAL